MKLAYIIPVHIEDNKIQERALSSLLKQTVQPDKVIIVGQTETARKFLENNSQSNLANVEYLQCGESSYQYLVNYALKNACSDIDWISILEYDDELSENATRLFRTYSDAAPNVEVWSGLAFILNDDDNGQLGAVIGCMNEAIWAPNLAEEEGFFDYNLMLRANFMFLNGSFIKKSIFDEIGVLKPKIKHFYDYEFTLRLVYQGKICKAIPKVTHLHYSSFNKDTSISKIAKLSEKERTFWMMTAKKEYFYGSDDDRSIEYKEK